MPWVYAASAIDEISSTTVPPSAEDFSPPVCGSSFRLRNSPHSGDSHRNCESANRPGTSETAEIAKGTASLAVSFLWTPLLEKVAPVTSIKNA